MRTVNHISLSTKVDVFAYTHSILRSRYKFINTNFFFARFEAIFLDLSSNCILSIISNWIIIIFQTQKEKNIVCMIKWMKWVCFNNPNRLIQFIEKEKKNYRKINVNEECKSLLSFWSVYLLRRHSFPIRWSIRENS